MRLHRDHGMTLIEILITLVIMAVLAGLAIPSYYRTVEQGRSNEARTNLNIIYAAQKIYRLNNGVFWNPGSTSINTANTTLGIDMTASFYDTISVTANAGTDYTARLTRNTTMGSPGTKWFQHNYTYNTAGTPPVLSEGGAY